MWLFSRDSFKDFPYEVVDKSDHNVRHVYEDSTWCLTEGKKKNNGERVSIFIFDGKSSDDTEFELAKTAVKRLKTLRHPSILQYIDSCETGKTLYLVTEYVQKLNDRLALIENEKQERNDLYIAWGIFQITRALSFLNNDGKLRHNNVNSLSVFVNQAGEWKLGGVEYMAGASEGSGLPVKILRSLEKYDPPEKGDSTRQRLITDWSTDMWGLGCLIWEVFNGPLIQPRSLKSNNKIPTSLKQVYTELMNDNPNQRPNPADIITRCCKVNGYFKNELIDTLMFLEEIQIKDSSEKNKFFNSLPPILENFHDNICKYKILPHLITAFEYGDAGAAVLTPIVQLGKTLDEAEYQKRIVPCVVKMFSSMDRATRSKLLQQLDNFVGHLPASIINDQIFPQFANGFLDTNVTIREQTVKSIALLAPKLNYNNLNGEVMRHFARLQSKDEHGGIRTNTIVCLGKIAQHIHPQVRQKVLISACIRAMTDVFPPARTAGIMALAASQQYFLLNEIARKILPALCQLTVDPDKSVRDNAFRTIKGFLGKLEKFSEDPSLQESMEADVHTAAPSLSNAAATWAGWAVSAVSSKFYRSQSDTTKSVIVHPSKNLHKPGSLEHQSSSSMSTTTSSVTSLEEASKGNESFSDYDDSWDTQNWGEIDASGDQPSKFHVHSMSGKSTEWGLMDEKLTVEEEEDDENSMTDANNKQNHDKSHFSYLSNNQENSSSHQNSLSNWDDANWSVIDDVGPGSEPVIEPSEKKRPERRQRQKDQEVKRGPRQGPMKLCVKKPVPDLL
ncbi:unnamed protein product [Bemisia tabaci]|uniref:N-terminal kinase-like protein n=1 Tax=Bemisia tabaci TaxID=7038 RepID=A0A9P0AMU3_BEMTA|nr:unnamed protein product [Bemisia tabaci]